jgi:predicted DCC family thiol-disulfide oxidoreductase YuxK
VKNDLQTKGQLLQEPCRLVYDAECRLCVTINSKLERAETGQAGVNIRFVPYQSEEAMKALGHDYRPGRPETAFLIRPSREVRQGLEAFLPVFSNLRLGKVLLWGLRLPFVRQLAERGYRTIARHRYRWFGEVKPVR